MNYVFFQRPALVFSLAALTLLTCFEVPVFISLFCITLWAWKWLSEMDIVKSLSRRTTTVLSFLAFGFVFFQYRTILSQESSSALLVLLSAIKVMDYQNRRDHLVLVLLGFLLLTLKPLYGMDLYWLPIQMVCMISLWWALSQDPRKIPRPMIGWIFAAATPIALALFFVFPRIVLPWALSQSHQKISKMGFSQDLNPGQVAELATSTDLVFRVRILSSTPVEPRDMYWKGARLTVSEGLSWKTPQAPTKGQWPNSDPKDNDIDYELIQEPGSGTTVFSLDPTYKLKANEMTAYQLAPTVWRTSTSYSKAQRFLGTSRPHSIDQRKPSEDDLQTPALPPKTAEWIRQTKSKFRSLEDRRSALHDLFARNQFVYTLTPGIYKSNDLDEFLFSRRRGFCEHFAGAYATLARALGIPSRVVSGYQGAEYNPLGDFWRVTQRQAHAWVETWNGTVWERQDPTLWVPISEYNRSHQKSFFEWIDNASDIYETLNYRWTSFLIDFDQKTQLLYLREWLPQVALFFIFGLGVLFLVRLLWNWFFTPGNKAKSIRQQQLALLVQQIKEAEEEYQNKDLSHWPPLQVLKSAQSHLYGTPEFYEKVIDLYDRATYQINIDENELKSKLKDLQKRWVEIQILQK